MERCAWLGDDPLMMAYHDDEWGVPLHDDRRHFEFIVLDGFQAGLSWRTVLNKRENFRHAFDGFDPEKIVALRRDRAGATAGERRDHPEPRQGGRHDRQRPGVPRHPAARGRIRRMDLAVHGWRTIQNTWEELADLPPKTAEAEAMSKALKAEGFKFVGPTICYAYMQAVGMVNDHVTRCYRWSELAAEAEVKRRAARRTPARRGRVRAPAAAPGARRPVRRGVAHGRSRRPDGDLVGNRADPHPGHRAAATGAVPGARDRLDRRGGDARSPTR